jgi:hypothetical protein
MTPKQKMIYEIAKRTNHNNKKYQGAKFPNLKRLPIDDLKRLLFALEERDERIIELERKTEGMR